MENYHYRQVEGKVVPMPRRHGARRLLGAASGAPLFGEQQSPRAPAFAVPPPPKGKAQATQRCVAPCCPRRLASPVLRFFAGCCCRFCSALGWSPTLGLIAGTSSLAPKVVVLRPKEHGRCALTSHAATAIGELHAASNTADCPRQPSPPRVAPSTIGIVNKKSDRGNLRNKRHKLNPSNNNRAPRRPQPRQREPLRHRQAQQRPDPPNNRPHEHQHEHPQEHPQEQQQEEPESQLPKQLANATRALRNPTAREVAVFSGPGARSLPSESWADSMELQLGALDGLLQHAVARRLEEDLSLLPGPYEGDPNVENALLAHNAFVGKLTGRRN